MNLGTMTLTPAQLARARAARTGDKAEPHPLWNRTTRAYQLPPVCTIEGVYPRRCQSGILFAVRDTTGILHLLDAAWFVWGEDQAHQP